MCDILTASALKRKFQSDILRNRELNSFIDILMQPGIFTHYIYSKASHRADITIFDFLKIYTRINYSKISRYVKNLKFSLRITVYIAKFLCNAARIHKDGLENNMKHT